MYTMLRAFCVALCLLTGVYFLILFRYYKSLRKTLWFPVLCFALALNVRQRLALTPYLLITDYEDLGIYANLYLVTFNLSSIAMNMYNAASLSSEQKRFSRICNGATLVFALLCFIVPAKLTPIAYLISGFVCAGSYVYGLYTAFIQYNTVSKSYMYSLISYGLLFTTLVPSLALAIAHVDFLSFRVIAIPIYLILHMAMLTLQYKESIFRTKKLADSLANTIESINHSDNALQCTQLKSDFLYNTLDLIRERCDTDEFTAEELTISLSKFLRHTLNFQQLKGIVPLSNELELTRAYIAIERERHPDFSFVYKLPEETPNVYVPPLSIQPLIENSIEHAFKEGSANPRITLTIAPYKEYCQIDVSDNGAGMPEEELEGLPDAFPQTTRIGLYSIHKRLEAKFGRGLVIQSAPGVGTSVSFVVPPEGRYTPDDEEVQ